MSALRLGRLPDGSRDVRICDDGAVGRTTHARYGIAGGGPPTVTGSFVVGLPKPRPDPRPRADRLFEGIVRCGLWMPRVGEHCYRRVGHADKCLTAAAVAQDTERRRSTKCVA